QRDDEQPRRVDDAVDQDGECKHREIPGGRRGLRPPVRTRPRPLPAAGEGTAIEAAGRSVPGTQHFAPLKPALIQSSAFMSAGGVTHSAGKRTMSTMSTRFFSLLYCVRPIAVGRKAWWPLALAAWILPAGDPHGEPLRPAAGAPGRGFLPPCAAIAFSATSFRPSSACAIRYGACTGYTLYFFSYSENHQRLSGVSGDIRP